MIILSQTDSHKTTLADAGEGRVFMPMGIAMGTDPHAESGRYLVVFHPVMMGVEKEEKKHFDNFVDAVRFYNFMAGAELYAAAKDAGLNDEWADKVARRRITLDAALGDMDVTAESDEMEFGELEEEDHFVDDHGGLTFDEYLAGGRSEYEYQQEKNRALYGE